MYDVTAQVKMIIISMFECNKLCLHLYLSRDFVRDRDFRVYVLAPFATRRGYNYVNRASIGFASLDHAGAMSSMSQGRLIRL